MQYCLDAGDADGFTRRLLATLQELDPASLPLEVGCTQGGRIDAADISFGLLDHCWDDRTARVGVFFTEVVGGCNCHDDPVRNPVYLVMVVRFDREGLQAEISAEVG